MKVENIPIEELSANPWNPRKTIEKDQMKELIGTVRTKGVLQPIRYRIIDGKKQIVFGHRRVQASLAAGLKTIPAILVDVSDQETQEQALIENINSRNLDPAEREAGFYDLYEKYYLVRGEPNTGRGHKTMDRFPGVGTMAESLGMDRSRLSNILAACVTRKEVGVSSKVSTKVLEETASLRESPRALKVILDAVEDETIPPGDIDQDIMPILNAAPKDQRYRVAKMEVAKRRSARAYTKSKQWKKSRKLVSSDDGGAEAILFERCQELAQKVAVEFLAINIRRYKHNDLFVSSMHKLMIGMIAFLQKQEVIVAEEDL